jgi:hypothetical protein
MRTPAPSGGRAILFASARSSQGCSRIARAFAEAAAKGAPRGVWLVDLDFEGNGQFAHYDEPRSSLTPGAAGDAGFGAIPFWRVAPAQDGDAPQGAGDRLTAHRLGQSRLFVSRFQAADLPAQARLQVGPQPAYWAAAKAALDLIVVDAPALERSRAGLAVAGDMDGVVLVADAQEADALDLGLTRDAIESRGGRCLGLALSNAPSTIGWGGGLPG